MITFKKHSQGFTIIELMLAMTIFTASQVLRLTSEENLRVQVSAENLGANMHSAMAAIDRRHSLDGYFSDSSLLQRWSSTQSVLDGLFGEELVGYKNPSCGKAYGWHPKYPDHDKFSTSDLLPCGTFPTEEQAFPFSFSAYAERNVTADNDKVVNDWTVMLYHDDSSDRAKYTKFYSHIIKGFTKKNVFTVSGDIRARLVDTATMREVNMALCISDVKCGILFDYKPYLSASGRYTYLRSDGGNEMEVGLKFHFSSTMPSQCLDHKGDKTPCGIDFDASTGQVNVYNDNTRISELSLISSGQVTETLCRDEANKEINCGFSLLTNPLKMRSAFKGVVADGTMEVVSSNGFDRIFEVTKGADVKMNKLSAQGLTVTGKTIASETLTVNGKLKSSGQLSAQTMYIDDKRIKAAQYNLSANQVVGQSCSDNAIAAGASGRVMSCVNNRWTEMGAIEPNTVTAFASTTCPSGWSSYSKLNSAGTAVVSGPASRVEQAVGVTSIRMTESTMPAHSHKYTKPILQNAFIRYGGGASLKGMTSYVGSYTAYAGGSAPINVQPGYLKLLYCVKN